MSPFHRCFALALGLALCCSSASCGRFGGDPKRRIAAEVGGKPVTVADVTAYLDSNLLTPEGSEERQAGELDRVKSRLFDDFIDEEILLREAERRGIVASDAELSDYFGTEPSPGPSAKDLARREILIQKLREAAVLGAVQVSEAEIDAWLAAHASQEAAPVHGTLRVLRFASYPEAVRVRSEVISNKLSFEMAEQSYGSEWARGEAPEVDLGALPDSLAAAVKGLAPGQVSQPVPYESSVLLLLLESVDDAAAVDARRRDRARQQLTLQRAGTVAAALLADLRAKTPVKLHVKALPFAYVAETRTAGSQ